MHFERDSTDSIIATLYRNHVATVACPSEIRGNTATLTFIPTLFLENTYEFARISRGIRKISTTPCTTLTKGQEP